MRNFCTADTGASIAAARRSVVGADGLIGECEFAVLNRGIKKAVVATFRIDDEDVAAVIDFIIC